MHVHMHDVCYVFTNVFNYRAVTLLLNHAQLGGTAVIVSHPAPVFRELIIIAQTTKPQEHLAHETTAVIPLRILSSDQSRSSGSVYHILHAITITYTENYITSFTSRWQGDRSQTFNNYSVVVIRDTIAKTV